MSYSPLLNNVNDKMRVLGRSISLRLFFLCLMLASHGRVSVGTCFGNMRGVVGESKLENCGALLGKQHSLLRTLTAHFARENVMI